MGESMISKGYAIYKKKPAPVGPAPAPRNPNPNKKIGAIIDREGKTVWRDPSSGYAANGKALKAKAAGKALGQ